jgi:phosphoglycerate kinase
VRAVAFRRALAYRSHRIGKSLFDEEGSKKVKELVAKAKKNNVELVFPVDYVTADNFAKDAKVGHATDAEGVPDGWMGLDACVRSSTRASDSSRSPCTAARSRASSLRKRFSPARRSSGGSHRSAGLSLAHATTRNGPAGVFEFDNFAKGSKATLDACIEAAQKGATVIVGGGDTATVCASALGDSASI